MSASGIAMMAVAVTCPDAETAGEISGGAREVVAEFDLREYRKAPPTWIGGCG
jgi:hypothetical protein